MSTHYDRRGPDAEQPADILAGALVGLILILLGIGYIVFSLVI